MLSEDRREKGGDENSIEWHRPDNPGAFFGIGWVLFSERWWHDYWAWHLWHSGAFWIRNLQLEEPEILKSESCVYEFTNAVYRSRDIFGCWMERVMEM